MLVQFFVRIFGKSFCMVTTNISEFRSNIRQYVDQVLSDGNPVLINRGNTAAVLISLNEYNSIRETEALIHNADLPEEIENGIASLRAGKTVSVNIEDL